MSDSAATTRITQVGTIFVPVSDQERALGFYVDVLGFEKRGDFVYGGGRRWIEVAPAGSVNALALVPSSEGERVPSDQTYCAFASDDIEADHTALSARGVVVEPIAGAGGTRTGLVSREASVPDPIPVQFFFRDPDGNRFLIVQPG
ncbi:VOC family protein [Compostimonas suwonensis]|uniref:Catechol 2,3-dioxygenase-like lactoylglutathione lyase family enzyme n=1 Tax=Compostimonas suwonensis TaxID=1048394 RepID=A0A2M9C0B8_9MICO|nr:VOC family protein [Compostimonas suwonensis]PJJ63750.1 catechol 2,3-dioxygenase-like lactoylglutathione lyase family enzyme [Compostimonas suwonensis]